MLRNGNAHHTATTVRHAQSGPVRYNRPVIRARVAPLYTPSREDTWIPDGHAPHGKPRTRTPSITRRAILATKIRLKRQGKKFYAFYRVVVVDSRKKRDGKVIEEIGTYNPNTQPSTIQIKSDRAQYWLGVGAQPSGARLQAAEHHRRLAEVQRALKVPKAP